MDSLWTSRPTYRVLLDSPISDLHTRLCLEHLAALASMMLIRVDQRDADVPVRIVGVVDRRRCPPRTRGFSGIPEPHFRGGFGTNVPLRDFADLAPAPRARVKPNSLLVGQEAAGCLQMVAAAQFAQSYTVPTHLLGRTGKRLYYQ